MRLHYSPLLFLLLLVGCSKADRVTEIPVGHLELVWAAQPEGTDEEPWFGQIYKVETWQDRIFVVDRRRIAVMVLDNTGSLIMKIGREGEGPGEFRRPALITLTPSGNIFTNSGRNGTLNKFSRDGEFIEFISYIRSDYESGIGGIDTPTAIDDSTIIYNARPVPFGITVEEELQTPLLITVEGDNWSVFAEVPLSEELNEVRSDLVNSPDQSLVPDFMRHDKCIGINPGEVLLVRRCDPYTVYKLRKNHSEYSFTYLDIEREEWARVIQLPFDEWNTAFVNGDRRYAGEFILLQDQRPPEISKGFTFIHTLRGLARFGNNLVVYVEIVESDFPNVPEGEGIEQKLYVVNLNNEQAEMVATFHYPQRIELQGALEDGTLIFSTNDPVPGILAYRIVPN